MAEENKDKDKKSAKDDSKPGPNNERKKEEEKETKKSESGHEKLKVSLEEVPRENDSKTTRIPSHEPSTSTRRGQVDEGLVHYKKPMVEGKTSDDTLLTKNESRATTETLTDNPRRQRVDSLQRRLNYEAFVDQSTNERRLGESQSERRIGRAESQRKLHSPSLNRRLNLSGSQIDETNTDTGQRLRRQSLVSAQIEEQVINRLNRPLQSKARQSLSTCTLNTEMSDLISQFSFSDSSFKIYPGTEQIEYDFTSERQNMFTTNIIESIAHLTKGCLGVGVLSIHEAWMRGGMWVSLAAMIFIGFLAPYTMNLLAVSAQKLYLRMRVPKLSFADLAEASIATGPSKRFRRHSKLFRYVVDIFVVAMQCCSCSLYQLACANTLKKIVEGISSDAKETALSVRIYVVFITAPLIFLCLIKRFRYLSLISMIADIVMGMCIITALYYSVKAGGDLMERPAWKDVRGFFNFCGVCLYSVDGITMVLPVENNMRYPRLFPFILQIAMGVTVLSVAFVGFFGYWGWGEDCKTPITLHIKENTVTTIMESLLIGMMLVSFAVQFWVPFRIVWRYIGKRFKTKRGHWENLFRILNLIIITLISVGFPDMNKMMAILGDVIVSTVAFIFPPIIETLVTWKEYHGRIRWTLLKNIFIMFCGLALIVGALATISW